MVEKLTRSQLIDQLEDLLGSDEILILAILDDRPSSPTAGAWIGEEFMSIPRSEIFAAGRPRRPF